MSKQRIPHMVSEDEALMRGIDYLRLEPVSVDVLLARHGGAADFGQTGDHEACVRDGFPVVGIEGVWWRNQDQALLDTYSAGEASLSELTSRFDVTALRTIMAARAASARLVLADVQHPSESYTASCLMEVRQSLGKLSIAMSNEDVEKFSIYQHAREWHALGVLGLRMLETSAMKSLLVFGRGHQGLLPKLESLGSDCQDPSFDGLHPATQLVARKVVAMSR